VHETCRSRAGYRRRPRPGGPRRGDPVGMRSQSGARLTTL